MKHTHLVAAFQNVNGASFLGIDSIVDVTLTGGKKNPQQGRVTKQMLGARAMVFQNKNINGYDAMVKRRLEAEGKDPDSFVLGERTWGTRIPNMPIIEHFKDGDTKYYLEVIFLEAGPIQYFLDGSPVAESEIIGLPVARATKGQGGVENKVVIRSFAAESITALRIDGVEHR